MCNFVDVHRVGPAGAGELHRYRQMDSLGTPLQRSFHREEELGFDAYHIACAYHGVDDGEIWVEENTDVCGSP